MLSIVLFSAERETEFYFIIFYTYLEVVGRRQEARFGVHDPAEELEWGTKVRSSPPLSLESKNG